MEQHFSLPFPSCAFSNTQFKTRGKTDPGSLLTFKACFQMHFSSAKAPWVMENAQLSKDSPDANLKQRAMTLSLCAFQQTVHSVEFQRAPSRSVKIVLVRSQERLCLQLQLLEALTRARALTLMPFVLRSVCGSVQHSLQTNG